MSDGNKKHEEDHKILVNDKPIPFKGSDIQVGLDTQRKVYSEQIFLLMLYAREVIYGSEHIPDCEELALRLRFIAFIENDFQTPVIGSYQLPDPDKEANTEEIKSQNKQKEKVKRKLIESLDCGHDSFHVMSLFDESEIKYLRLTQEFVASHKVIFSKYNTHQLPYRCSQLSAAVFKASEILTMLVRLIDIYITPNNVQKQIDIILRSKSDLESVTHALLIHYYRKFGEIYEIINKFVEPINYKVEKEYSDGKTKITFDSRLSSEGDIDSLIEHIRSVLSVKNMVLSLGGESTPMPKYSYGEAVPTISPQNMKDLTKWYGKGVLNSRLDVIAKHIALIVDFDVSCEEVSKFKNINERQKYVTDKLQKLFYASSLMSVWCNDYDESSVANRFKKRVPHLAFGLRGYKPVSIELYTVIAEKSNYPFRPTTYPPLWVGRHNASLEV